MNLLDQLNSNINMDDMTTSKAGVMPFRRPQKDLSEMKFTHMLIKHLDLLYGKMLAGEISEMNDENNPDIKEIGGHPFVQTKSWYNPGHSAVTESM